MLKRSLVGNLVDLAVDEGKATALQRAEELQQALETIGECGTDEERANAYLLLRRVNRAIEYVLKDELIQTGVEFGTDSRQFREALLKASGF